MWCLDDLPGRPTLFRKEVVGVDLVERGGGEERLGGRTERGNCSHDGIYEKRIRKI